MARLKMFRTHKYSSRPEGPGADSTRATVLVTGRSSRLEYKRADSTRRCQSVQSKASRLQLQGVDPNQYPSWLEGVRADSKHDDRQHNGYILQPFQNSNSQTAISQVTTVWNFKNKYKRGKSSIRMIYKKREKNKKGVGALILSNTQRELRRNQKKTSSPHTNQIASWSLRRR